MTDRQRGDEDQWIAAARRTLDASEDAIDPATQGRLRAARREALSRATITSRWRLPLRYWAPAAFSAALVLFGFNTFQPQQSELPRDASASTALFEDLPLLSGEDDLDMLSDLEFYLWLAESDIG